jgi:hypothetical protein
MNRKGFTTLEASMLLILCVAAGIAMYGYVKRAVQGNWRGNIDAFSDEQFEPGVSKEIQNKLIFQGARINADVGDDESIDASIDITAGSGIIHIPNWGAR